MDGELLPAERGEEEIVRHCLPRLEIFEQNILQRSGEGDKLLPPVFHFRKEYGHILKINVFDAQIDNGAGAVSRSDKVVDQRPIPPFYPPIGFRLLKKSRDLGVGIRFFDRIVFLHQLDGEKLHILPLCAELEEDPQTADTGIERGSLLPGVNLLDEEIFKYFAGNLVCIPGALQMGEEVFKVFLIILNCPRAEVFDPAMIEENGLGFFQRKTLRKPRIFNTCAMPHNRFFLPKKSRYCRVDKI